MKNLENIGDLLKNFIDESMQDAIKLNDDLAAKKAEKEAKQKQIEEVQQQLDYIEMLRIQLEEKKEMLLEEEAIINALLLELDDRARQNRLENILDNMVERNDGEEEIIDEGK